MLNLADLLNTYSSAPPYTSALSIAVYSINSTSEQRRQCLPPGRNSTTGYCCRSAGARTCCIASRNLLVDVPAASAAWAPPDHVWNAMQAAKKSAPPTSSTCGVAAATSFQPILANMAGLSIIRPPVKTPCSNIKQPVVSTQRSNSREQRTAHRRREPCCQEDIAVWT